MTAATVLAVLHVMLPVLDFGIGLLVLSPCFPFFSAGVGGEDITVAAVAMSAAATLNLGARRKREQASKQRAC